MPPRYDMSDELGMVAMETAKNACLGGDAFLACSAQTQACIDELAVQTVRAQYDNALELLRVHRAKPDEISDFLYERETIADEEFMLILRA